ncbi:tRNA (adenosine(37)-N6)-dimethylallyltransferase MiaA [Geobacter sp. DSM 9736]|uniref:tRNA (adenosine(37)-N6)-dimethylallyltransferase MiaA n=1 Tax=Geobacter sp. DSM 9736 TaxID=1277350 RepID=UPI000B509EBA|nr:tRNA (adenosine(37)-N6)-dimethylallyltransferase MiaA [Geobacter sp. DSM 9736]
MSQNSSTAPEVKLVILLGPTASGKTELALRLAQRCGGEIVNADSMQVYRGMDIGTAKPSSEQMELVPHHLIDIATPDMNFSAADFREAAAKAIEEITGRGSPVFLVGGTGLYLRALLQGLVDSPPGNEDIRSELNALAEREGKEAMLRRLSQVDPFTAARLHVNDQVRIIRALEVYCQTGRPISEYRDIHRFSGNYYRCLKLGIDVERQELYRRIESRVDEMFDRGLIGEVERLLHAGYSSDQKSMRSIGYRQVCAFLNGEYGLEEAVRLVKRDTRRYAKRQMTWFRTDPEIKWVEYPRNFDTICCNVIDFLSKGEGYAKSTIQHPGPVP